MEKMMLRNRWNPAILLAMILLMSGCEGQTDRRLLEMAQQHSQRQSEQSRQMLELQQEVASGSKALVEADAKAREEFAILQHDLQTQRSGVDQQRDQLEQERQAIAEQRYRDPLIAAVITHLGLIIICLLPLLICWHLLRQPIEAVSDQELTEILLNDLVAQEPLITFQKDKPQRLETGQLQQPNLLSHPSDQDTDPPNP